MLYPVELRAQENGEAGIRTQEPPFGSYAISNRVLSAAQTPLHCKRRTESCANGKKNGVVASKSPHDNAGAKKNGEGEIRTLEGLTALPVFETSAFNHSATSPNTSNPRREQDSNLRGPCGPSGFQDRRIQPLCHLSLIALEEQPLDQRRVEALRVGKSLG